MNLLAVTAPTEHSNVEITHLSTELICGRIDFSEKDDSVHGTFVAVVVP